MSGKGKGKKQQKDEQPAAEEPKVTQVAETPAAAPAEEENKGKGKGGKGKKSASPTSSPAPTPTPAPVEKKEAPAPAPEKKSYNNDNHEQTFLAIKPDGVQRGLVGEIISRFEKRGFKLVGLKLLTPSKEQAEGHYDDLKTKKFFAGLVQYFTSGPIVAMVWQGKNVVGTGRTMLGETNPLASAPGTIRGDFSLDIGRNVIHGSDSVESAKREIAFWFKPEELNHYNSANEKWIYE